MLEDAMIYALIVRKIRLVLLHSCRCENSLSMQGPVKRLWQVLPAPSLQRYDEYKSLV